MLSRVLGAGARSGARPFGQETERNPPETCFFLSEGAGDPGRGARGAGTPVVPTSPEASSL